VDLDLREIKSRLMMILVSNVKLISLLLITIRVKANIQRRRKKN